MADEEDIDVSKPKEPPKPVHIGGESLADRILPHLKKIIVSVIVIAVILSIFFGIRAWKQSKQSDETEKVAKVMQLAQRKIAPPPIPGAPPPDPDSFADAKARAAAILDEAAKRGAEMPPAVKGGLMLDKGDVDGAIREYKVGTTKEGIEGVLSREGYGIALETKAMAEKDATARQKGLEEALAAFGAMQPKEGYRRAYALYHQGRIQQVLGKSAEAKALFEQAKTAGASSSELAQLIEKRLASLGAS
jgi:predicted negative regulator of RcsB-dependent stress response